MIQINPYLIQLFVTIEALLVIVWGLVKGGIDMRRMVFAGSAVIFAFTLPWVLSHLAGFGDITTYQLLQKYAENAESFWAGVYQLSSKVMLVDAGAMTALDIIEMLGSFGLSIVPQQYMTTLMALGWALDPVDAIVESINHAAQVLVAIFHTIAWLAWFSWAIAPTILGIALVLIIPERTRPAGTALLLLTLAIMFFTSLAAYTLGLSQEAQLINSINQTLATIEGDLPANVTVRGYLLLQSNYPYLVSGQLMNETMVYGRACYPVPQPVSWFIGFTPSVGLIDQFAYPQINNVTLLWLEVNAPYQCDLLIWPPGRNITQGPEIEQCTYQYFNDNETFAEVISLGNPPFNLIEEELPNGTTAYTGAWEWVNPPSSYSVISGNNTVTINATINIPPMHCINITTRAGPHRVCYPGTASADLWVWASSINYPSKLSGGNWVCTLGLTNSSMYEPVDLTSQFNTIKAFMGKLINETEVSKKLIYPNASVPTYALPSPTPNGYRQMELSINCINWSNSTVVVPITITIHGVANNPWFGGVPFLISPADAWIINSPIIGDEPLLINWWDTDVKQFLGLLGIPIAQWLGELAIIYGLLDGVAWFFGLPTILSPVYAIMQGVIMELSLVLYLQIRAVSRLMQRAIKRFTKAIGSRLQSSYQALSNKHPKLAKALSAPGSAVSRARQFLHDYLGSWVAHRKAVEHMVKKYASTPRAASVTRIILNPWYQGLSELEQYYRRRAREYEETGHRRRAQLHRFLASSTRFVRDYGRIRALAERGRLFEYTRPELSRLNKPLPAHHLEEVRVGDLAIHRPAHQLILTERLSWIRRTAHVIAQYTRPDWAEVFVKHEGTEFGSAVRRLYESGEKPKAAALILARELGERYIGPVKAQILLVREDVSEVRDALAKGNFIIKHVGDKTIVHFNDARLNHILESLKQFSGYGGDVGEALGRAIERATAIVRASLTRGVLKGEYVNEVASRLRPIRDFVEATSKGAIVSLDHPVIQRFIEFVGPESERVVREVLNARGWIDKDGTMEIMSRLKPLINRRVNEEVEAARYIVALRHHADEVVREFARELGIDKKLNELEGELRELEDFVRRAIASEFPILKDRVADPNLIRGAEVVRIGNREYVVVREPFNRELSLDWQLPKEILGDEGLTRIAGLWVIHHYADRLHGWLARRPGDAIFYNSVYSGWTPGAVVLAALHGLGLGIDRLDWGGLLDKLERLEERISKVKAQLREARDENEKARLSEELKKLKDEREGLLKALITWANAIEALKLALPKEEWETVYNALPKKMRDFVDVARDPRDSFEAFLKRDGLKIMAILDREGRKAGRRLGVDEVKEAVDLLKNHLSMLDRLIGPVKAELVGALTRRIDDLVNELKEALGKGLFVNTKLSAESARLTLEQARQELGSGNLDNAIRDLKVAIDHLREAAREDSELARAIGRLDESVKQLEALNALDRLMRGQAGPVDRNQPNEPSFFDDLYGL